MFKITLRPLGPYFFGTERGFGGADNASYFAASKYFPQQSTILGMLRYRLLEMNGWLTDSKGQTQGSDVARKQLIGPHGFYPDKANQPFNFGAINWVSPVWLEDHLGILLPGPLDRDYSFSSTEGQYVNLCSNEVQLIPDLGPSFDPKQSTDKHLLRRDGIHFTSYDEVFVESQRVGITKDRSLSEDKAFFKQQNYQFRHTDQTRFIFYVDLDVDAGEKLMKYVNRFPQINMGGERSTFHMTMTKETLPETLPTAYQRNHSKMERWVLLSDAYIPSGLQTEFQFGVTGNDLFRGILSNTEKTKNYADIYRKNRNRNSETDAAVLEYSPRKSDGYPLLTRGSVLYPKASNSMNLHSQLMKVTQGWQQIGYNWMVRVKDGQCNYLSDHLTTKPL